jgi:type III secretory pathway component EscS
VGGTVSTIEGRLREALVEGARAVEESPDLFARVQLSIEDDRLLRRQRQRTQAVVASVLGALAALVAAVTEYRKGELLMDWWILELIATGGLAGMALWLGPLIKRYGKSYAADVFRANPRTGKSFVALTDVAYYLIFFAYILFTVSYEPKGTWAQTVNAQQLQHETARLGGILLIIGLLHGVNLLALPIMGRLLTLNRRLDEGTPPTQPPAPAPTPAPAGSPVTPAGPTEG